MALTGAEIEGIENNIIFAIQNKLLMRIYYRGDANVKAGYRIIEPYVIGYGATGEQYVRAYAVDGVSKTGEMPGWKLLLFYRIRKAKVRFTKFQKRFDYVPNDSFITARLATVLSKNQKIVNSIVMENRPVYKCVIDPEDKETGVRLVSIVDEPAIERYFVAMSKHKTTIEKVKVHLSDDDKRIVTGPVMIPDKLILRRDEAGNEFNIYFDKPTILECAKKFFRLNSQNESNANHDQNELTNGVTAFESWIIRDSEKDKAMSLGMQLPEGTWMLSYHITDNDLWQKIKSGELKGFSLEGFFDYKAEHKPKEVNNQKQIDMNKVMLQANDLIEKIKSLFAENEETQLAEEWQLADGTVLVHDTETGTVTMQDGTPAADGEYILADNRTVVVSGGMLVEIKEVEEAPAETAETEMMVVKTTDGVSMFIEEGTNMAYVVDAEGNKTEELVADGEYTLEDGSIIEVVEGVATVLNASEMKKQFEQKMQELMAQVETATSKYEKLKAKYKETEEKLTAVSTEFETFKSEFGGEKPNFKKADSFSIGGKKSDKYASAREAVLKYTNKNR